MKKVRRYIKNLHYLSLTGVISLGLMTIVGTGGGGGGGTTATDTTGGPYEISGYIQKGPFISGSSITIQELDDDLNPTGISYETSTIYDFGAFSLGSQIESRYVEVIANGFYFDEVKGELSAANLRLRATTDLLAGEDVNINIPTTLEQDRIEYLIANEGLTFTEARAQAEIEVLSIFNISGDNISTFDQMDISQEGDSNAILLAVSSILQGSNTVAELSELISKINLDIKEDGTLDNSTYVDEIKNNSMNLDLNAVRANLANRYQSLGLTVTIPDFEAYVDSDGDGILNGNDDDFVTDGPTNVSATRGNEQITISWDSISGAISYNIYWATSSGVSKADYDGKIEDINITFYAHTGLTNETTYYYVVTVENSYEESTESGEVSATPSATGTAPSAPTNVSAIAGDGQVTISWDAVSGATSYNIYWAKSSGVSMDTYEGKIEDITTTSYTHTDFTNGTTYYYIVTAENDYGESDESTEVSATPSASDGGSWVAKTPMPTARSGLSSSAVNGIIYTIGGNDTVNTLTSLEAYDPSTDTWSTKASLPENFSYYNSTTSCVFDGIIYVTGGHNDTMLSYDPTTDSWATKTFISFPMYSHSTVVVNGVIFIIGGQGAGEYGTQVQAYDIQTDTWSIKSSMPTPRWCHTSSVVDGIIYTFGGADFVALNTVEAYDPVSDTWSTKAPMPTARHAMTSSVLNGIIYVIGKHDGLGNVVEAYDPATNTWSVKENMPTNRSYLTSSTANNTIFVIGGQMGDHYVLSTVEAFTP